MAVKDALIWLALHPVFGPAEVTQFKTEDVYLSGRSEYHQIEANGTTSLLSQRSLLDNRYQFITRGRNDNELVFYKRGEGVAHTRNLNNDNTWSATVVTSGLPATFDMVTRGDFIPGEAGYELAFYDRTASKIYIYRQTAGGKLVEVLQQSNFGINWTAMTAGRFAGAVAEELVLYDHADGKLRFLRVNGNNLIEVATRTGLTRNNEWVLAVKLDGVAQPPSLLFYNVDTGQGKSVNVDASRNLQHRQTLSGPSGEYLILTKAELGGDAREDLLLYEQDTGIAHFWQTSVDGTLSPTSSVELGNEWTHLVATRPAGQPLSDLYLYTNSVDIVVDFVRVNDNAASLALNFPLAAPPWQRSATRAIEWLNQSYRPAGMHFQLGQIHEVHDDAFADGNFCARGEKKEFAPTVRHYGDWLGNSRCTACVALQSPNCFWGAGASGAASCDAIATGACSGVCQHADWSICNEDEAKDAIKGCLSATTAPEYREYCKTNCPSASVDRMLMAVYPFGGTLSCSGPFGQFVHFRQSAFDHQYFVPHESGHYFALSHNHVTYPPTSSGAWDYEIWDNPTNQHLRGVNDTVALFHSFFFRRLGINNACDDGAGIVIPDSGACLVPHMENGCSKASCQNCVEAIQDSCYKGDEPGELDGVWNQSCVDIATTDCASQCQTSAYNYFAPERHNPMAYGTGDCSAQEGIFKFSRAQLRRARELLFKERPGLIQPTPLITALPPKFNYAPWSYGGLYLKSYRIHWSTLLLTFEDANGNIFTGWEKDGHRCPTQPTLVLNTSNPDWLETADTILRAGLAHKPMHVWFWGQTEQENADPERHCYLQGVTVNDI